MLARRLKAWMPRSLYWRATLILLIPVLTILLVVTVVFFQRYYEDVTQQMSGSVVQEVRLVLDRLEGADDAAAALEIAAPLGIEIVSGDLVTSDKRDWFDISGRTVIAVFRESFPTLVAVDLATRRGYARLQIDGSSGPVVLDVPRGRLSARNPHQFLVLIGFTAVLMSGIALIYLANQMRPIRRLALAAEAFGKGRTVPYRPSGATEVRLAGAAFLDMRDRIERQIEQRTMMLSGVSHDLKTPLTRMKLGLSLMDEDDEVTAMRRDVSDMENMLEAFLAFARSDALDAPTRTDPIELARDIVRQSERAYPVSLGQLQGEGTEMLRPVALRRAIENLVMNAVRYGNEARLSASITENAISFVVEDSGPGIPPDKRQYVLKPFSRLDAARNQNTGSGVGLGLTIASDIARRHGGSLIIGVSRDLGGARIELLVPR
ncbi:MAG: HAMP domain-containing protein [Silicimonas sp.]|nr:HAMP domain-containing protein [Silicimonas sp.]